MRDRVERLRQLLAEATPMHPPNEAGLMLASNEAAPTGPDWRSIVLDDAPRARAEREIMRIASWYGWGAEIVRAIDAAGCVSMAGMSNAQIEALQTRMKVLEECVQEGLDPPDAPPAR